MGPHAAPQATSAVKTIVAAVGPNAGRRLTVPTEIVID
jgi:hypothetical protein